MSYTVNSVDADPDAVTVKLPVGAKVLIAKAASNDAETYRFTKVTGDGDPEYITGTTTSYTIPATPEENAEDALVTFGFEEALADEGLKLATVGSLTTSSTHGSVATAIATGKDFTATASTASTTLTEGENEITITLEAKPGYYFASETEIAANESDNNDVNVSTGAVSTDGKTVTITLTFTLS